MMEFSILRTAGWSEAIEGMRSSFGSEHKSDSTHLRVGPKDLELMLKLAERGSSHRKFMRAIQIWARAVMPLDWWSEWDTYKVATVRLSASTMHTLKKEAKKPDFHNQFHADTEPDAIAIVKRLALAGCSISKIKKNLPCGFLLKSIVNFNYETALNIYNQRENHELEEWVFVCDNILSDLPYFCTLQE